MEQFAITRFLELARHGRSGAASTGEKAAYKLAKALDDIGDDMMLLDSSALEGFHLLSQLASGPFRTDAEKSTVFDTIHNTVSPRKPAKKS